MGAPPEPEPVKPVGGAGNDDGAEKRSASEAAAAELDVQDHGEKQGEDQRSRWGRLAAFLNKWKPITEGCVAVAAVVGIALLTVQSCAMLESNKLTREAYVASRRATLFVTKMGPTDLGAQKACKIDLLISNYGELFTGEAIVVAEPVIGIGGAAQPDPRSFPTFGIRSEIGPIPPKASTPAILRCNNPWPEGLVGKVQRRQWRLYTIGRLHYGDGFGVQRVACFCGELNPEDGTWTMCDTGNLPDCKVTPAPAASAGQQAGNQNKAQRPFPTSDPLPLITPAPPALATPSPTP